MTALTKPRTRKQVKAKRKRTEAAIIKAVRAAVDQRDGYCRIGPTVLEGVGWCEGASEWAHLGEWRRSHTRGMAPEDRHHERGSLMLCARHHRQYDAHAFDILYGDDGANGDLIITTKGGHDTRR